MNKIFLCGAVGKDPQMREFEDGNKVANFSLATTKRGYTTQDGHTVEPKTLWHNITCKNGLATIAEKYIKKGTKLLIEGEINYREYTKDDMKMYVTEIIADNIEILSKSETPSSESTNDKPF